MIEKSSAWSFCMGASNVFSKRSVINMMLFSIMNLFHLFCAALPGFLVFRTK